jgi:hypothetical protein
MHQGFNLTVSSNDFKGYDEDGIAPYQSQKAAVRSAIDAFKNSDGSLNASKITANWFPNVTADVFISHSQKDSQLAIRFAGYLRYNFGITSFVDSCVWGYSDDLLKILDKQYCWQEDTETYNYKLRNRSTSHVHMMLTTALCKMLNSCECIIFVNTPSSILPDDYINGNKTDSPWIYVELAMSSLIQRRRPSDHREITNDSVRTDEAMRMRYDVSLSHLKNLSVVELSVWEAATKGLKGPKALDALYAIK